MGGNVIDIRLKILDTSDYRTLMKTGKTIKRKKIGSPLEEYREAVYYDTPDSKLLKNRLNYRIERMGEQFFATIEKFSSAKRGYTCQKYWTVQVSESIPKLDYFDETGAAEQLEKASLTEKDLLEQRFTIHSLSKSYPVTMKAGEILEMIVEKGEIVYSQKRQPFREVRIKSTNDKLEALFQFAVLLSEKHGLTIEPYSLFERRLIISEQLDKKGLKRKIKLKQHFDIKEVQDLLFNRLMKINENQTAFLENPEDPETVHQLRVDLRKVRSVLSALKPLFQEEEYERYQNMLKQIGKRFSFIRETDVLIEKWAKLSSTESNQVDQHSYLMEKLENERKIEQKRLTEKVRQGTITTDLLRCWLWILSWDSTEEKTEQLEKIVKKRLNKWMKLLQEQSEKLTYESFEQLHELRIKSKKIRYTASFMEVSKEEKKWSKKAKKTQNRLGKVLDVQVNLRKLADLKSVHTDPLVTYEIGIFTGYLMKELVELQEKMQL